MIRAKSRKSLPSKSKRSLDAQKGSRKRQATSKAPSGAHVIAEMIKSTNVEIQQNEEEARIARVQLGHANEAIKNGQAEYKKYRKQYDSQNFKSPDMKKKEYTIKKEINAMMDSAMRLSSDGKVWKKVYENKLRTAESNIQVLKKHLAILKNQVRPKSLKNTKYEIIEEDGDIYYWNKVSNRRYRHQPKDFDNVHTKRQLILLLHRGGKNDISQFSFD